MTRSRGGRPLQRSATRVAALEVRCPECGSLDVLAEEAEALFDPAGLQATCQACGCVFRCTVTVAYRTLQNGRRADG